MLFANLSWGELAAMLTVVAAFIGLIAWAVRAEGRSRQNSLIAAQALTKAEAAAKELEQHKVDDAERYATWDAVNRLDDKISAAINRLGEQLIQALLQTPAPAPPRRRRAGATI